jgi:hypothetical protein
LFGLQATGLQLGSKQDQIIWDELHENLGNLAYESQKSLAKLSIITKKDYSHKESLLEKISLIAHGT